MPEALTAVLDSTVLVSAFLTEGGVSAALLRSAREGVFLVCLSEDILTETEHTLVYPRIHQRYPYTDEDITDFLNRLRMAADLVDELPLLTGIVRDPNDDMIIATARAAHAAYIVTRDNDLLTLCRYEEIMIVTPEAFMGLVRARRRDTPTSEEPTL